MSALQVYREGTGTSTATEERYRPSLAEQIACVKVDALPYIDSEITDTAVKAKVDALVREEMGRFTPKDYLAQLHLDSSGGLESTTATGNGNGSGRISLLLQEEMRRMERGERLNPLRATVEPPPKSLQQDLGAWQSALLNAETQLAHQDNRVLNLELLSKYGASVWLETLKHTEALNTKAKNRLENVKKQINTVNAKRKMEQTAVRGTLQQNEYEWWNLTVKNQQIKTASNLFEQEIKKLRTAEPTTGGSK